MLQEFALFHAKVDAMFVELSTQSVSTVKQATNGMDQIPTPAPFVRMVKGVPLIWYLKSFKQQPLAPLTAKLAVMFVETCPPVVSTAVQASFGVEPLAHSVQILQVREAIYLIKLEQKPIYALWSANLHAMFVLIATQLALIVLQATHGQALQEDLVAPSVQQEKAKTKIVLTRVYN